MENRCYTSSTVHTVHISTDAEIQTASAKVLPEMIQLLCSNEFIQLSQWSITLKYEQSIEHHNQLDKVEHSTQNK